MAYYRQSKRRPAYDELVAQLPSQEHIGADETPTRQENNRAWLWSFVAQKFTVFSLRASREATAISELLTDKFRGIVMCNRARMYWRVGRLRWCWSHLNRDFQALIDSGDPQAKWLGYRLRAETSRLFEHWGNYRDGPISRAALVRRMGPVRREIERLLLRGAERDNAQFSGMCRELHEHRDWLWAFLRHDGVEPTNNASERSLRHAVIWRKLSFGTQSAAGSRFVETLLTVIEACRQQNQNTFDYLTTAIQATLDGNTPSSLLPRA